MESNLESGAVKIHYVYESLNSKFDVANYQYSCIGPRGSAYDVDFWNPELRM